MFPFIRCCTPSSAKNWLAATTKAAVQCCGCVTLPCSLRFAPWLTPRACLGFGRQQHLLQHLRSVPEPPAGEMYGFISVCVACGEFNIASEAIGHDHVWNNVTAQEAESLLHRAATSYSKYKRQEFHASNAASHMRAQRGRGATAKAVRRNDAALCSSTVVFTVYPSTMERRPWCSRRPFSCRSSSKSPSCRPSLCPTSLASA